MSVPTRKIGYYYMDFTESDTGERSFDKDLFKRVLAYIDKLDGKYRVIKDLKANKAMDIEGIEMFEKDDCDYAKVIFKSCKFNHSPNYMSSEDGSERRTDKKLTEGEKEVTHLFLKIKDDEAYAIFEERRSGVSMKKVIDFLNNNLINLNMKCGRSDNRRIEESIIPSDDFLTLIDKAQRIVAAQVITDKKMLGTGYMNLINLDNTSREDIEIIIRAKTRESLGNRMIRTVAENMISEDVIEKPKRLKIYAKDENNMNTVIDTNAIKKCEEITVTLKKDGTVDSESMFNKMEQLLEDL